MSQSSRSNSGCIKSINTLINVAVAIYLVCLLRSFIERTEIRTRALERQAGMKSEPLPGWYLFEVREEK